MNTGFRTACFIGTRCAGDAHGRALELLLSLVVLGAAGCGDMAPPAASAVGAPQPGLSAPAPTLRTPPADVSPATAGHPATEPATGAGEGVLDLIAAPSGDKARVVFLHGLHSPFGMALAMSRIPTPR